MRDLQSIAVLFDLDGVVLDTEWQYDEFWGDIGLRFRPDVSELNKKIKGSTIGKILSTYFPDDISLQKKIFEELEIFERNMKYIYIPGAHEFLKELESKGIKKAIVTSSTDEKMEYVLKARPEFRDLFQGMVTANMITKSKPDPECFLLGATQLNTKPDNSIVFEDSYAGMEAGNKAGMKVIGLYTTNPKEKIEDKVDYVIPNFEGFTVEKMLSIMK